jgi:hypothetical protein
MISVTTRVIRLEVPLWSQSDNAGVFAVWFSLQTSAILLWGLRSQHLDHYSWLSSLSISAWRRRSNRSHERMTSIGPGRLLAAYPAPAALLARCYARTPGA